MDIVARLFAPWRKPENKHPEMDEAAAEIERLREENKRLRQVTMACWGALAELSPCAHEECCQPQTEALDLALRMAEAELKHNAKITERP